VSLLSKIRRDADPLWRDMDGIEWAKQAEAGKMAAQHAERARQLHANGDAAGAERAWHACSIERAKETSARSNREWWRERLARKPWLVNVKINDPEPGPPPDARLPREREPGDDDV
jgi:hypothetical protein